MSEQSTFDMAAPQASFEPSKKELKKTISVGTAAIKKNLKAYAGLMDTLLKKADKLEEVNEKQKAAPKNRALAKASVKADLEYQKIQADVAEAESTLDAQIGELARNYYSLSDTAKKESEKNKICENGKDVVQNFENLKADIEGRAKDRKAIGDIDYYLSRKDDAPAPEENNEENETEGDNDMNAYENNQKIDALAEEVRRLASAVAELKDKGPMPCAYPYPPERPSFRIAPVTIDISREISKAVECAMDKFSAALENRLSDYAINLPAVGGNVNFDISDTVNEALQSMAENVDAKIAVITEKLDDVSKNSNVANMEAFGHAYQLAEQVSDDENFIMNKLTDMLENIKTLNEKMVELSAAQMEIAEKQQQVVDLQRQTNDVQRYTLREQEGIQVNQKVIGKDQIAVIEKQAVIAEEQKNIAGIQAEIIEAQKVTAADQKAILDSQTAIEGDMKAMLKEQENFNNNQREILKGSAQNYDIQQEIASLQVEITNAQKDVIGNQKQILRDQKAVSEKQKANGDMQNEVNEELKNVSKATKALADSVAKAAGKKAKKEETPTEA